MKENTIQALLDVVNVEVDADYALLFAPAKVGYGTVIWTGNIDIAPKTLYDRSLPIDPSILKSSSS